MAVTIESIAASRALPRTRDRLDAVLIAVTVGLLVWTAGFVALPQTHIGSIAPAEDLILDTVGLLSALAISVLGWIRYRETGDGHSLFQAAAFLVLAVPNSVHLIVLVTDADLISDLSVAEQGEAPVYAFAISTIVAALLLIGASLLDPREWRPAVKRFVVAAPALLLAVLVALVWLHPDLFPQLGSASRSVAGGAAPAATTSLGVGLAGTAFVLLLVAALVSRRQFHRSRPIDQAFVTVGLVIAAFVQVDNALHPAYAGFVTVGDLLRIAFYLVLLAGLVARTHAAVRELSASNLTLAKLKDAEAERAALEERARVSRELHDGLSQSLWYVKLKATRLTTLDGVPAEVHRLADDVTRGVDESIDAARQAVLTLRSDGCRDEGLGEVLARTLDEFEDRYGVRTDFTCDGALDRLPTRTKAELLRICQEALTNVARHADASLVRVGVNASDHDVTMAIKDNGLGFDPARTPAGHFGLAVMRERASLIGGHVQIASERHGGTVVAVTVPLASD